MWSIKPGIWRAVVCSKGKSTVEQITAQSAADWIETVITSKYAKRESERSERLSADVPEFLLFQSSQV